MSNSQNTFNSDELSKALENSKQYLDPPCGYQRPSTNSIADRTIISQNNTIIGLLEITLAKVRALEVRIRSLETLSDTSSSLEQITSKISDLSLGKEVPKGIKSDKLVIVKYDHKK